MLYYFSWNNYIRFRVVPVLTRHLEIVIIHNYSQILRLVDSNKNDNFLYKQLKYNINVV